MPMPAQTSLSLCLRPSGAFDAIVDADAAPLNGAAVGRIGDAFAQGAGAGILHLGLVEVHASLPPAWAWLRELGRQVLAAACRHSDLAELWPTLDLPPPDELAELVERAPPFRGRETLRKETLSAAWMSTVAAFRQASAGFSGTVHDWLAAYGPSWHAVGRLCLHLAENRRDPELPFAFLATWAARLGADGRPQHVPLGRALQQAQGDPSKVETLLAPVRRAAVDVPLIADLVESRGIFRPQKWGPGEAMRFLRAVPALEAAGLVVRVPSWWATGKLPRARVRVTVGPQKVGPLNASALLSFQVGLVVDGPPLTDAERDALLASTEGMVLLRGKWVEVDAEALAAVMDQWTRAQDEADANGLSFFEGMRMLAGLPAHASAGALGTDVDRWSEVTAGPALSDLLRRLRQPGEGRGAPAGLKARLRPYQASGLDWLWTLSQLGLGACLADDMGLGKTLQVLALLLRLKATNRERAPSLVVLPTSLVPNWQAEAARFAPSLRVAVAHPSAGADAAQAVPDEDGKPWQGADVVLTTYGMLHRDTRLTKCDWDLLVLDEAQAIKNAAATRSRAVRKISSRACILLTGTPVENRAADLWALMDVANPGLLGTSKQFAQFCQALGDDHRPLRQLISPYLLRRLKTDRDVISDLPEKVEMTVWCGLSRRQAAMYADAVDQLAKLLATQEGVARRGAVLAALTRFKQLCDHPALIAEDPDNLGFPVQHSSKLSALLRLATDLAERQDKVLVFTQYRSMMDALSSTLARAFGREGLELHGGVPLAERARRVKAFQDPDGPPFFVLSLRAAGTGLNLTQANHVVHFDRWWNPAVENQATDRAFRIGQTQTVLVHRLVCRGTVEERIDQLIAEKAELANSIVGGKQQGPSITELDDAALLKLVALDLRAALDNSGA